MGPKKGRRNLKRLKTTEVAERAKEPPDPQDNSEPGAFVPFSGAGHSLGEGCGLRRLPVDGRKCNVKPAAGYLLFPEPQTKWPPVSEGIQPVDRKMLVYHMDARAEPSTDVNEEDLPEDFFQVTSEDVKKRYAQLQTDRRELEEAPLLTSALREDHMIRQMQRHPKVVIRICFPDRHVLQGVFRPLETVGNLKQFVRNHLIDPQLQFCLCKSVPECSALLLLWSRNRLFPASTLLECHRLSCTGRCSCSKLRAEVTHLITHLTCSGRVFSAPRGSRGIDQSAEGSGRQLEVSEEFVSPHTPAFRLPYRDAPQASGHSGPPHTQVAQAARKKMKICSEEKWLSLQEWNTLFLAGIKQEHFWFFLPLTQNLL
ncbi:tether containing UBX domain for GLUT4-like isoform X2 [Clupea harengus]|uniref:Tether containing UBX domain for GLUT4-like isoform X2 n=1 Tax=Clupea harengus TaxID=7950 RepID=A0A6P8EUW0_CLUHA|nr:tether containing UBX domain for GLUT4-like isoform X2 [Clupea harengus]